MNSSFAAPDTQPSGLPVPGLPSPGDPARPLLPLVQHVLDEFVAAQRAVLSAVSPATLPLLDAGQRLLRGGKRLRPTFCYWGWRAAGGAPDDGGIVTAAAAFELFQAAALVHDDLIDRSDTRRGQPAVHRQFAEHHRSAEWAGDPEAFGAAAAILLGDLLLGWSDELFDSAALDDPVALRRGRAVFDQMRTEVGGGQYLDVLEQANAGRPAAGRVERARTVIRYKSARYSVEHPLVIGASLAGAGDGVLAAFRHYGGALGEAFQLRDDILGVFGDAAHTGKPSGDDLREGKRTLLVAFALEHASAPQADVMNRLLGSADLDDDDVEALRRVITDTGALARAEALVSERVTDASAALDGADITNDGRRALLHLIDLATTRTH